MRHLLVFGFLLPAISFASGFVTTGGELNCGPITVDSASPVDCFFTDGENKHSVLMLAVDCVGSAQSDKYTGTKLSATVKINVSVTEDVVAQQSTEVLANQPECHVLLRGGNDWRITCDRGDDVSNFWNFSCMYRVVSGEVGSGGGAASTSSGSAGGEFDLLDEPGELSQVEGYGPEPLGAPEEGDKPSVWQRLLRFIF